MYEADLSVSVILNIDSFTVTVSYNIPTVIEERNNLHKRKKIHWHLRNEYFVRPISS